MERVISTVTGAMAQIGYSEKDIFTMHLSLDEAIVNAHKHAHGNDRTKPVFVYSWISTEG
jgi:anti-sigma regulatory factor (Ser/Thr protein kinase)